MSEYAEREQALLAEIPWMRQLARELVADSHGREDVVQDACWIALTQPPRSIDTTKLRAWLRRVLRTRSWLARRAHGRNAAREHLAARAQVQEPVDAIVARAELQRRLLAEVLALRTPLREALLLRYYRGQDSAAIAEQLGLSQAAVRQRISRAIAELRERTRDNRDLRDLLSAVASLPIRAPALPRPLRWTAGLCAGVIAAIWIPVALSTAPACALRSPTVMVPDPVSPSPAVGRAGSTAAPNRAQIPPPTATKVWLELLVVDRLSGQPLAGATIARARAKSWQELADDVNARWTELGIMGSAGRYLTLAGEEALPPVPGTENDPPFSPRDEAALKSCDRNGRVSIENPLPNDEYLIIRCAGHAPRFVAIANLPKGESEASRAPIEVQMHPSTAVRVIVHTVEGETVPDAFARLEAPAYLPEDQPQISQPLLDSLRWYGPSDDDGGLMLEGVPLGESLVATPLSRFIGNPTDLLLSASSAPQELRLSVIAPGTVSGRLVDCDGKPVAGTWVSCSAAAPWFERQARVATDEEGRFELTDLPAGPQSVRYELTAPPIHAMTGGAYKLAEIIVEPFARLDIGDIQETAAAMLRGRVIGLDAGTNSVGYVKLHQGGKTTMGFLIGDGTFELRGEPGPGFVEVLTEDGWTQGRSIATAQVELPCEALEIDARQKLGSIAFQIPDGTGSEVQFSLRLYNRARDQRDWAPSEHSSTRYGIQASSGALLVNSLPIGEFALDLQASDGRSVWIGQVKLEGGKVTDLGRLDLVSGRVHGSVDAEATDGEVIALRHLFPKWGNDVRDERRVPLGRDGCFEFKALPQGYWCLRAEQHGKLLSGPANIQLTAGADAALQLQRFHSSAIHCRVHRAGNPVAGAALDWNFELDDALRPFFEFPDQVGSGKPLRSDAEGNVVLDPFYPGGYGLSVKIGDQFISRHVDLAAGQTAVVDFDFANEPTEIEFDLPAPWAEKVRWLQFLSLEPAGESHGLQLWAQRIGTRSWELRAPPSRGALTISMKGGWGGSERLMLPFVVNPRQRHQTVRLPAGEVVIVVAGAEWGHSPPDLRIGAFPTGTFPARDTVFTSPWPLEHLADGNWLARGIEPGSTLILSEGVSQLDGRRREQRVHFEGGRLELNWP